MQQLEELGPGEIFSYQNTRMEFTLILVFIYINMLTHQMNYRSWRIHWGEGGFKYITNLESSSQVLFDQDIAEIQNFKS
ncbi:hypothetical protein HID58_021916, partial [Brassica napus]